MADLNALKEQLKTQFPLGSAAELEAIEKVLSYESFGSEEALTLGCEIARTVKAYGGEAAVRITRESDELAIFQYVMDGKKQRNIDFGLAKRQTVLKTGHCSLWAMAKACTEGTVENVFSEGSGCLPVGGAFPIYASGKMIATVFVSGLHDGLDQVVIVKALEKVLNKTAPVYHGALI